MKPRLLPTVAVLAAFSLLICFGCSGGGGGGSGSGSEGLSTGNGGDSVKVAGEVRTELENLGLKTLRAESSELTNPVIVVGGVSEPDALANDFDTAFKCREKSSDSVFELDARTADGSHLQPPSETIQKLQDALNILQQKGIQHGQLDCSVVCELRSPVLPDVLFGDRKTALEAVAHA